jgi:purine-binding chemotaxis protein CheW
MQKAISASPGSAACQDLPLVGEATPVGASPAFERQVLTFRAGCEWYGIGIRDIVEILRYHPVTPVPGTEKAILGLLSRRGRIITVIDVRVRLGAPVIEPGPASRIIVTRDAGEEVGLLVDAVMQVVTLPEGGLKPPPAGIEKARALGVIGICDAFAEAILVLIDLPAFLGNRENPCQVRS